MLIVSYFERNPLHGILMALAMELGLCIGSNVIHKTHGNVHQDAE